MFDVISYTFGLILITISLLGYGNILKQKEKNNDLFLILISGYFFVGLIVLLLHFFTPINNLISISIIILGIILFIFSKFSFNKKKFYLYFFYLIVISFILIGYSEHPIDASMYHHPYVSYLKSQKIIYSIANIEFRFGHISLLQYVQSAFSNTYLNPLTLSNINIIFFTFFLIFSSQIIFNSNKNNILFLATLLFSSFVLIKMGRYREFGNDLIPFLVASYFLIILIKEQSNINHNFKNSIFIYLPIYFCFMLSHKITYIFSCLIFLSIINKDKIIHLIKNKYIVILFFSFTSLWLLKNYIETSCLIYPVVETCNKNSGWYLTGIADPKQAMWLSEIWSKDFINHPNWRNIDLTNYSESFNWLPVWINNHFIKILEKLSPLFIIMLISSIYFIFINKKNKYFKNNKYFLLITITLALVGVGLFVWFIKSPLFRYGSFYIVSFTILLYLILNFKLVINFEYKKIKNLKIILLLAIIFFFSKNIVRQIDSENKFFPLTKPSIENYIIRNKNPTLISPKKILSVCYYTDFLCSHEIPENFKILKKKNYLLIK